MKYYQVIRHGWVESSPVTPPIAIKDNAEKIARIMQSDASERGMLFTVEVIETDNPYGFVVKEIDYVTGEIRESPVNGSEPTS